MAGLSLFLLTALALPFVAAPQDTPQEGTPNTAIGPTSGAGVIDNDLSFKDLVLRTYDPRWMLQAVRDGEAVETHEWSLDSSGHATVVVEEQGVIARIWISQAIGRVRIYADGSQQPTLDWDLEELFSNRLPAYLNSPLFMQVGSGFVCRIPLPFAKSVRLDFDARADSGLTGEVTIRRFAKEVSLASLTPKTLEQNVRPLRFAAQQLRDNANPETVGETPLRWSGSFRNYERNPNEGTDHFYGDFRVVFVGDGVLRWFEIEFFEKLPPQEMRNVLRNITLRMELNSDKTIEVGDIIFEVPLGDFLGTAPGLNPFATHLVGYNEAAGVFYFRMPVPFTGGLKVSLSSDLDKETVVKTRWGVNKYAKPEDVPPLRLHSGWVRGSGTSEPTAAQLVIPGQARLLGYTFSSTASVAEPQIFSGPFSFVNSWVGKTPLAFEQLTLHEGPGNFGNTSALRIFGLDAPTATSGLDFQPGIVMAESSPTDYSALAWWYAPEGSTSSFPTDSPQRKRWPLPVPSPSFFMVEGAFECESLDGALMAPGSKATVVQAADTSSLWSRLQHLDWQPTAAKQVLNFPFPVSEAGRYKILAQFAQGEAYGKLQVLIDGRRIGEPLDFSSTTFMPSGEIEIGELRLMKRLDHKIAFMTLDGKRIGLDYFRLQRLSQASDSITSEHE